MKAINLKDYYPYYTQDMYIEVSDELAQLLEHFERKEANKSGFFANKLLINVSDGLLTPI